MENIAGTKSSLTWAVHIAVALLVLLWLFPDRRAVRLVLPHADQISASAGGRRCSRPSRR
jgi:alpha-glucoside transport system permease protein